MCSPRHQVRGTPLGLASSGIVGDAKEISRHRARQTEARAIRRPIRSIADGGPGRTPGANPRGGGERARAEIANENFRPWRQRRRSALVRLRIVGAFGSPKSTSSPEFFDCETRRPEAEDRRAHCGGEPGTCKRTNRGDGRGRGVTAGDGTDSERGRASG